jgi:hypothetical protein
MAEDYRAKQIKLLDKAKKIISDSKNPDQAIKSLSPELKKAIKQEYGYAFALIMSSPDLTRLFTKAISQGMTPDAFQKDLQQTDWYSSRTASQRTYDTLLKDKGAKADLAQRRQDIMDAVKREAVAANGTQLDDADVAGVVDDLIRNHWDNWQEVLPRVVGDTFVGDNVLTFGGTAAASVTQIKQYAKSMGVFIDDTTLGRYVDNIASQKNTLENVFAEIGNLAASYYPQYAENIKSGATVDSIAQQYTYAAAQMLEKDPADFNFFGNDPSKTDPLMAKAMFGGKDGKGMSMYDFRKLIKQDNRWKQTRGAREEYASITNNILKTFGAV